MPFKLRIQTVCLLALSILFTSMAISASETEQSQKTYELRTYTTYDGKLPALNQRFQLHTVRLLEKHGMTSIGYWIPVDDERSKNTLIYIIAHKNREEATKNWTHFSNDPEWQSVFKNSHKNGKIVKHVESIFMSATAYSKVQ